MAYTPPNPDAVDFHLESGYEAPEGLVYFASGEAPAPRTYDLNLEGPVGRTNLDLGATGDTDRTGTLVARVTPTRAALSGGLTIPGTLVAKVAKPRASMPGVWDPNLLSDVVGPSLQTWDSALACERGNPIQIEPAALLPHGADGSWSPGAGLRETSHSTWDPSQNLVGGALGRWSPGESQRHGNGDAWRPAARLEGLGAESWQAGTLEGGAGEARWHPHPPHFHEPPTLVEGPTDFYQVRGRDYPPPWDAVDFPGVYHPAKKPHRESRQPEFWRDAGHAAGGIPVGGLRDGPSLKGQSLPKWNDGRLVPYVWRIIVPVEPVVPWEHWGNDLCLWRPLDAPLDLGVLPGCPGPEPGLIIPRRRTYIVVHDIEVVRLPDRYPIACAALAISLDADAWAWSWSGTLLGAAALEAVLPVDDEPVTIEASIDGYLWHLLVEEWSEDRAFGSRAIRASGRGLTAWLAAPYQLPGSGVLANARTIQQLMDEHLPLGEGWTLVWRDGTPDWLIPAGAWSWAQRTPMQAIHEAALGVGLVVLPARTARELHVLPRYPVLPWDYATATPDLEIPDAAILQLTRRRQADAQANAVYVHGAEVGGLLARVYRTGSAGDRLASTESHPLITHVDGARLFGSRILAAHESQPEVRSITLPLGGDFPLPELGQLVSVELGAADIRGTISGLEVAVQRSGGEALTVRQTITLGEEAPNLWARFRSLLPVDPLLAGEATILHGDGTVTVTLIGGGTIRVRGEAAQGQMVYIRGGRIEGEAPDLTGYEIEV